MNKINKLVVTFVVLILAAGCRPDDDASSVPLRDYAQQYATDIAMIEQFLRTHSIEVVDNPGNTTHMDVTYNDVAENAPNCLMNDPRLTHRMVTANSIEYKLYYLKLNPYDNGNSVSPYKKPTNVDAVLTAYRGHYLYNSVTQNDAGDDVVTLTEYLFESVLYPQSYLELENTVRGWGEVMPKFYGGLANQVEGQPTFFTDFEAGIMFLPSGLAYYNQVRASIPAYSPLIFAFKLYDVNYLDQDADGILSRDEDLDGDGYMYFLEDGVDNPDDTDGDGIPDYRDVDDDGDMVMTKTELQRPAIAGDPNVYYYKYNGALVDDPSTPYDDTQGAPRCFTGPVDPQTGLATPLPSDFTDPTRLRKYLDPNCQ